MSKLALAEPTRPALRYAHDGCGHGRLPGDVGRRASAAGTVGERASGGAGFGWFGLGIVAVDFYISRNAGRNGDVHRDGAERARARRVTAVFDCLERHTPRDLQHPI